MPKKSNIGPGWITLGLNRKCTGCAAPMIAGQQVFRYPQSNSLFCIPCGGVEASEYAERSEQLHAEAVTAARRWSPNRRRNAA